MPQYSQPAKRPFWSRLAKSKADGSDDAAAKAAGWAKAAKGVLAGGAEAAERWNFGWSPK